MNIGFQYRELVLLLAGIPVLVLLFLLLLRWKKKTKKRMGDPALVSQLIRDYSPTVFTTRFLLICLAYAAGVVAVMNLRQPGADKGVTRKGIDVVVALDISKSMLAEDVKPSRLNRAREFIHRLADRMPDDRMALVLFAGKAYLQMPLTTDHEAAKMFVSAADPASVTQQGTVLSDAMEISALAFNDKERRFKTVILISDGEDHDPDALATARRMADHGIMINTIGIGSKAGSTIPDPLTGEAKKDLSGNVIISRLNEEELRQIAGITNGLYLHLENTESTIKNLQSHLSQIEKKSFTDLSLLNFNSYYYYFAGLMFLLLLGEFFLSEKKWKTA